MTQLIENPRDFACQDLEKKKNKILVRFISWVYDFLQILNFSNNYWGLISVFIIKVGFLSNTDISFNAPPTVFNGF
jgi:hypothetical protein